MIKKLDRIIKLAKETSEMSDHHSHKLGAVIFDKRGRIFSIGHNWLFKTHPEFNRINHLKTLHAEASAVLAVRHKHNFSNLNIFVYRENKQGKMENARPCQDCVKLLKNYNLKWMYYTINNNIVKERIE